MKHPLLFAQSVLSSLQVFVGGLTLEGILDKKWAAVLASFVGAAQLGVNLYQHGAASDTSVNAVRPPLSPEHEPVAPEPTPEPASPAPLSERPTAIISKVI